MVIQLDNMTRHVELLTMPNGTHSFPARSCCDLKEQYPDIYSGKYIGLSTTLDLMLQIYVTKHLLFTQVCTGLIPTVAVQLMPSKFTVTMRMEVVLPVLMLRNGYICPCNVYYLQVVISSLKTE